MNKEQMNKIVKAAQEQFEVAKNLILQEMQVALDEADHENCSENELESIINKFTTTTTFQICDDEESGKDAVADDEDIAWINEDAIDFDKDYNEIGILIQNCEDGSKKIAIEYDSEMEHDEVYAMLAAAMTEVLYCTGNYKGVVDKCEISSAFVEGVRNAIVELAAKKIIDILS